MPVTTRQQTRAQRHRDSVTADRTTSHKQRELSKGDIRRFGLVQEIYQHNLYHLIVQAILWNQTHGKKAIIILKELLVIYPDPKILSEADEEELTKLLQPIGLHRLRAKRLIALGHMWIKQPPIQDNLYKVRYKCNDVDSHWEIAHLPGIGKYAIDSYRIFHRDQLRGLATSWDDRLSASSLPRKTFPHHYHHHPVKKFEPEWKRVLPTDKDLKAFLIWAWLQEGFHWDPTTGIANTL